MKLHKWFIFGVVAVIIAAAGTAGYVLSRPHGNMLYASVRIEAITGGDEQDGDAAVNTSPLGLAPDASFSVTSGYRVTEQQLRAMLEVDAAMGDFTFAGSGRRWRLTPGVPLEGNSVYTIRVKNPETNEDVQSFAFQTRSDLLVSAVYPMNGSNYVEPSTGIEITFNSEVTAPEGYIEIKPETVGKLTVSGNTVVFRPDAPLTPESIYRVTIKAGLTAQNGAVLKSDVEFSFETTPREQESTIWFSLAGEFSETFVPGDPLAVGIYAEDGHEEDEYSVTVHRYGGGDGYIKELGAYGDHYDRRVGEKTEYVVATEGLEEVAANTGRLYRPDPRQNFYYALLPDELEAGYYVVTISGMDEKGNLRSVQKLLQLTNISVYSQSSDGETLVWLNNAQSGGAQAKTRLVISGVAAAEDNGEDLMSVVGTPLPDERITREAVTQADGTARIMTSGLASAYLTVYGEDGAASYHAPISVGRELETRLSERYYSALYTDREIYKPSDRVNIWGVVQPRRTSTKIPAAVYAVLASQSYRNEGEITRVRIPVAQDGTFSAELPLDAVEAGAYLLRISDGEKGIYRESVVTVDEYEKPPFVITVAPDKDKYYMNEPLTLKISAAYFDGTPLANGALSLRGDYINETELQLDAQGNAEYTASFTTGGDNPDWGPISAHFTVSSVQDEDIYISGSCNALLLPSRVAARIESQSPDRVTVETATLDAARLDEAGGGEPRPLTDGGRFERLAGSAVDVPVTIEVKKTESNKTPSGSFYDYVNKRTVTSYTYNPVTTVVETIRTETKNGVVTLTGLPYENTEEVSYEFIATIDGGVIGAVGVTSDFYPIYPRRDWNTEYRFAEDYSKYVGEGDTITIGLYRGGLPVKNAGRVLYSAVQRKIVKQGIFTSDTINETVTAELMPNATFCGAYFDGRHVYSVQPYRIMFNPDNKKLNVEVTTDKQEYLPREKATVKLLVTDRDGKPVSGSACIGIVDEAVFAVAPQNLDLAGQLYEEIYNSWITSSASYNEYDFSGTSKRIEKTYDGAYDTPNPATAGAGPAALMIRSEFVDTALFSVVSLDTNGRATVELTLPDNLTEWRVTAAAVTGELEAGQGITSPVTTLPFYLRPLVTENFLVGDDVAFSVSAVGTGVKKGDAVDFSAVISDASGREVDRLTASAPIGERAPINFGRYDAGEYTVTISGKSGSLTDAVKEDFTVIKSGLIAPVVKNLTLAQVAELTPVRYPVQLQIYDERMAAYMEMLAKLSARSGERTETIAAAYGAREVYEKLFEPDERGALGELSRDPRLSRIQSDEDGGVRMLEKSQSDVATTAKLLVAAPELISVQRAVEYLRAELKSPELTADERALAQMGLAAAKQPVLLDIERILGEDETLTSRQRLYYAMGLAKLGDFDGARAAYGLMRKTAVTDGLLRYFDDGESIDDRLATTAAAAMLTSLISHPDADGYMRFLNIQENDRSRSSMLTDLEQLACVRGFVPPDSDTAARFTYTDADKMPRTETLERGYKTLTLDRAAFGAAHLKSASGKVWASVRYLDYMGGGENDSRITVTKTYTPASGELKASEKVLVTITVKFANDAPEGSYVMTDYIPSGMRYMCEQSGESGRYYGWGGLENEGQLVRGYINYTKPEPLVPAIGQETSTDISEYPSAVAGEGFDLKESRNPDTDAVKVAPPDSGEGDVTVPGEYTFKYYVSASLAGEFVTESVYITPESDGVAAYGKRGTIDIK